MVRSHSHSNLAGVGGFRVPRGKTASDDYGGARAAADSRTVDPRDERGYLGNGRWLRLLNDRCEQSKRSVLPK